MGGGEFRGCALQSNLHGRSWEAGLLAQERKEEANNIEYYGIFHSASWAVAGGFLTQPETSMQSANKMSDTRISGCSVTGRRRNGSASHRRVRLVGRHLLASSHPRPSPCPTAAAAAAAAEVLGRPVGLVIGNHLNLSTVLRGSRVLPAK